MTDIDLTDTVDADFPEEAILDCADIWAQRGESDGDALEEGINVITRIDTVASNYGIPTDDRPAFAVAGYLRLIQLGSDLDSLYEHFQNVW